MDENKRQQELEVMLEKLRKNREKVPLDILKTRYAAAYNRLVEGIKDLLFDLYFPQPDWFLSSPHRKEHEKRVLPLLLKAWENGGYSKRIGRAAFQEFNADKAAFLCQQARGDLQGVFNAYFETRWCLYCYSECFAENPKTPLIYNDIVEKVWISEGNWRNLRPEETEPSAMLIFIPAGKTERKL